MYAEADTVVVKKTVQVVNCLVEWYKDSLHRTIHVDCFYTSMELLKSGLVKKIVRDWNDRQDIAGVQKDEEEEVPHCNCTRLRMVLQVVMWTHLARR
jgi:hypothetical protein